MLILAIDTSAVASAALVSDDALEGVVASFSTEDTRSHAEVLAPGIEDLLASAGVTGQDIDAIVGGRGPRPVHRPAFRDRDRPHARLRLGQAAVRTDEPRRRRAGSGGVHRRRGRVPGGHRRPAQRGLLGPLHPRGGAAAAAGGRPARQLRRRPAGPARPTAPVPGCTATSCARTPNSARNSPTPCTSGSSRWPGWPPAGSCSTPRPCTSGNRTPRCPGRGSGHCEHAGRRRPIRAATAWSSGT